MNRAVWNVVRSPILAAVVAVSGASLIRAQTQPWEDNTFIPASPSEKTVEAPSHSAMNNQIPQLNTNATKPVASGQANKSQIQTRTFPINNSLYGKPSVGKRPSPLPAPPPSFRVTQAAATADSGRLSNRSVTPALGQATTSATGVSPTGTGVAPASHADSGAWSPSPYGATMGPDAGATIAPPSYKGRTPPMLPGTSPPADRMTPPSIVGSHLGLLPGETATERSMRLMSAIGDLERQVEELSHQNSGLASVVKEKDEKLMLAVREIKSARKDLANSRDELERLKQEVKQLSEKVRAAEKENAAVLQTMMPLLQQLLDTEEATSSLDDTTE